MVTNKFDVGVAQPGLLFAPHLVSLNWGQSGSLHFSSLNRSNKSWRITTWIRHLGPRPFVFIRAHSWLPVLRLES